MVRVAYPFADDVLVHLSGLSVTAPHILLQSSLGILQIVVDSWTFAFEYQLQRMLPYAGFGFGFGFQEPY